MNHILPLLWHLDELYHAGNLDGYEQCLFKEGALFLKWKFWGRSYCLKNLPAC